MASSIPRTEDEDELVAQATAVKLRFLSMYKRVNAGHVGCSLSCAELLTIIRLGWMRDADRLVLSKGHAAAGLYATLAEAGAISEEDIASFYQNGTRLAAHPPPWLTPDCPFATGSLGHGLSLAAGLALGARMQGLDQRIYCITSDGELNEGSTWEAMLFARHHRLNNLTWLIDRNGIQGFGRTEDVLALEPLAEKLAAFGLEPALADGHDFTSLKAARKEASRSPGPEVLLCKTIKGNGVSFMADTVACHYLPMSDAQYQTAVSEITAASRPGRRLPNAV